MKVVIIYSILFSLTFFSCTQTENPNKELRTHKDSSLLFTKEIPKNKNRILDLFYLIKKEREKDLHLDTLESGYDSLQFRIWYEPALLNLKDLIVLEKSNGKWSGVHYSMITDEKYDQIDSMVISSTKKSLTPKSGWNNFIDSILKLQILTLPHMWDIPGLVDNSTDGTYYNVEIATKKQYRFYSFHNPNYLKDKYWQVNNMDMLLELIRKEFNLPH